MSIGRKIAQIAAKPAPKKKAKPALKKIVESVKEALTPDEEPAKEEE